VTRLPAVLLALTLSCAPAPAPAPEAVTTMPDSIPLVLTLAAGPGPGVRALLRNVSPVPQAVLVAPALQPVGLSLVHESGWEARRFDENTRRKIDRTVYREMFETLAPGDSLELQSGRATRAADGTWALRFGPWTFGDLRPGRYTARATWTSALDGWTDRDTGRRGTARGLWKGSLTAEAVALELP
jgi:hypothetical protein